MTKKSKFYFPVDEKYEKFSLIATTQDGLIFSLNDFVYKNAHLTLFVKELEGDNMLLDIHLTQDGKNKSYPFRISFEYNKKELEKRLNKKIEVFKPELERWVLFTKEKTIKKPKDIFCLMCFGEDNLQFIKKLKKRKTAVEFFREIESLKNNSKNYIIKNNCKKDKHNMYLDSKTDERYIKMPFGFIHEKDWKICQDKFNKIFEETFKEELKFAKSIFN